MLLNFNRYSWSADIHTAALGKFYSLLLTLTDTLPFSTLHLNINERSLGLPGCQSKSAQVRWHWSTWKGLPHIARTNSSHVPASVTFSDFPPMTRMKYCCFHPRPISSLMLGIPIFSHFQRLCSCSLFLPSLSLLNPHFLSWYWIKPSSITSWTFLNCDSVRQRTSFVCFLNFNLPPIPLKKKQ